jgi:hypothetical protein
MYGRVGASASFWGGVGSEWERLGPAWVFDGSLDIMSLPAGIAPRLLLLVLDILHGLKSQN